MKPKNNRRWNRCRIDEDYCINSGHGEQFFRAFDKAFGLKPINTHSSSNGEKSTISVKQVKSSITHDIATEVGKHLLSGALNGCVSSRISKECSGSNPDGSVQSEQAGATSRHPNMPATSGTKTMLGAGQDSASSPPTSIQNIIDSEADKISFNDLTPTPSASGTTLHQFQSFRAQTQEIACR